MARLLDTQLAPPQGNYSNFKEEIKAEDAWFKSLDKERLVRFQIADGYACYFIVSRKPLVLQHVRYGDGWRIPEAHIRGLREQDIRTIADEERFWKSLQR